MSIKDRKIKLILTICGSCLVIFIFMYNLFGNETQAEPNIEVEEVMIESEPVEEPSVTEEGKSILVDIKGAVHSEGVFEAKDGMRIKDVIEMAGGFTEDAEHRQVNLAQRVQDEMVIYVPRIGESKELETNDVTQHSDGKISLNKATQEELETLTGIGPSKAAAIISYREEFGPFKQLEDLLLVSGIGQKSFEKLKDNLKLD